MALKDLTDAELGHLLREGPLWQILLETEEKNKKEAQVRQPGHLELLHEKLQLAKI